RQAQARRGPRTVDAARAGADFRDRRHRGDGARALRRRPRSQGDRRHAHRPQGQKSPRNMTAHAAPPPAPPVGLLVELTHRCPLGCPYCSNPLALERPAAELDGETWKRVFSEAAALGALHVHLSGGEPTARRDIAELTWRPTTGSAIMTAPGKESAPSPRW